MKRFNKKILLIITLFITLLTIHIIPIGADSGFDSSWDSDSGWDSGSSWDSSSNYSSNTADKIVYIIILIIIIIFVIVADREYKKTIKKVNEEQKKIVEDIKKYIPDYDEETYKNKFYNIYVNIQEAWMNFDYDVLKNLTTDELYNMYSMQLDTLKTKNQQNIMSDFKLVGFRLENVTNDNGILNIETRMTVLMYDYLIDTNTKKIVRGTKKQKLYIQYMITFVKSNSNNIEIKCPNCGTKLDITTSGKCPYCNSEVVVAPNDFVMSKKENIGQRLL